MEGSLGRLPGGGSLSFFLSFYLSFFLFSIEKRVVSGGGNGGLGQDNQINNHFKAGETQSGSWCMETLKAPVMCKEQ